MTHEDHVRLIEKGIRKGSGEVWADFGSGEGAFTLALRDVAGENTEIYSIDKNEESLTLQKKQFEKLFPDSDIKFIQADFMTQLNLPPLDGLIAANSIHFQTDTVKVCKHLAQYLKPNGRFIVVEYNVDQGNMWVPYPFSFSSFQGFAQQAGLTEPELLAAVPSRFLNEIYASLAFKKT